MIRVSDRVNEISIDSDAHHEIVTPGLLAATPAVAVTAGVVAVVAGAAAGFAVEEAADK